MYIFICLFLLLLYTLISDILIEHCFGNICWKLVNEFWRKSVTYILLLQNGSDHTWKLLLCLWKIVTYFYFIFIWGEWGILFKVFKSKAGLGGEEMMKNWCGRGTGVRCAWRIVSHVCTQRENSLLAWLCSVTWRVFPLQPDHPFRQSKDTEERLKVIPKFCFPDPKDWCPTSESKRWETV